MKLFSVFLMLILIKVALCKTHQRYIQDSESLEGDSLIDKILASNRFNELADKIVDKTIKKINDQQSTVSNPASNDPEIETKKSNINPNPEFKSIRDLDKKNVKTEIKSKKSQKRYKPGKINIEAVMQKKILPSDDLTFRYNRFTRNDKTTTVSDKPLPTQQDAEKVSNLNVVNENEESTTKHKIIKKPSANDSEEQNKSKSDTDEESNSGENDHVGKATLSDISVESTKFTDSDITRVTKLQNDDNPFGNEKVIVWNARHSDNDDNDSNDKSDDEEKQKAEQTSSQVTKKIISETQATNVKIPHLFRAETVSTLTPKHNIVNGIHDNEDFQGDDQEDTKIEHEENKNRTKEIIRREGDRTYVLKDSSDYQEYHEQLAKMKKAQR